MYYNFSIINTLFYYELMSYIYLKIKESKVVDKG